jgi:tRNA-specific 2-thiouridylase
MRALALFSGGLDSVLAVKLISEQDIDVVGVNFRIPFNTPDIEERIKTLGGELNIDIRTLNLGERFLKILKTPQHGYGKNMNPCIDCRILCLKEAHELMQEIGAKFLVTGEVLGQRPMSQKREAMRLIEKESGLEGLIVRPLSAKRLPVTIPEEEGWIEREKLLDIEGRSRKKQLALAREYNISGYSSPAGGCLLTDPEFSRRIEDLLDSDMLDIRSANLVKSGRYFKVGNCFKLVVGRNHEENLKLVKLVGEQDIIFEPEAKGPVAIGFGKADNQSIEIASQIVAYYCKPANLESRIMLKVARGGERRYFNTESFSGEQVKSFIVEKMDEHKLLHYKI